MTIEYKQRPEPISPPDAKFYERKYNKDDFPVYLEPNISVFIKYKSSKNEQLEKCCNYKLSDGYLILYDEKLDVVEYNYTYSVPIESDVGIFFSKIETIYKKVNTKYDTTYSTSYNKRYINENAIDSFRIEEDD